MDGEGTGHSPSPRSAAVDSIAVNSIAAAFFAFEPLQFNISVDELMMHSDSDEEGTDDDDSEDDSDDGEQQLDGGDAPVGIERKAYRSRRAKWMVRHMTGLAGTRVLLTAPVTVSTQLSRSHGVMSRCAAFVWQGMLSQERQRFNTFLRKAFNFVHQEKLRSPLAVTMDGTSHSDMLQSFPSPVFRCVAHALSDIPPHTAVLGPPTPPHTLPSPIVVH